MKKIIHPYKILLSLFAAITGLLIFMAFATSVTSCGDIQKNAIETKRVAVIFPEYYSLTLPPNIAPLNFVIKETGTKFRVEIKGETGNPIVIKQSSSKIKIPVNPWHKLLKANSGITISFEIWSFNNKQWNKYQSINHQISKDTIDPVLVYRLVYASYLKWNKMGVYQRDLTSFEESPLIENNSTDNGCVNCHTFSKNNPSKMAMHFRIVHPGTLILNNGKLTKTNTKTDETMSAGIYPAWHPDGIHIAFSTGKISPHLTTRSNKPVDVADKASGLFVYNTEKNTITTSPEISTTQRENLPEWSADGRYLYFTSAPEAHKNDDESLLHSRYSLMRIAFDSETETWGKTEEILNADSLGMTFSMPAASPDGKFMVCSVSDFGYFTIFHKNSDLYLINLETRHIKKMEVNSKYAESHSSWSLNSRWLVFSSKQLDGVFTRPYISFIDTNGFASAPFLLPQEDPEMYDLLQANYNRPDLVTGKVELSPIEIRNLIVGEAQNVEGVK